VDGCGKTTLCRSLEAELSQNGIATQVVWSRFRNYLSKPLLGLSRLTGHNRRFYAKGEWIAHHDFSALPVFREAFALFQAVDVNIGAYFHITRPRLRWPGVSICERGPWDTLVDVMADTGLDKMMTSLVAKWYVRQMAAARLVIWIRRDPEAIFRSRPALHEDPTILRRAELYERLAVQEGWFVVDNNGSLEQAKAALRDALSRAHLFDEAGGNVA
jgi:thymidylate kinase